MTVTLQRNQIPRICAKRRCFRGTIYPVIIVCVIYSLWESACLSLLHDRIAHLLISFGLCVCVRACLRACVRACVRALLLLLLFCCCFCVCVFSSLFFFFLDDFFIFFILTACSVTVLPQVLEAEKRKTAELYIYIYISYGFSSDV